MQRSPWLLMLSFHAPHSPLHAPPAHLHSQSLNGLNPATSPGAFYRAMVEAVDAEFGRLLRSLGPARNNTNIFVMSDNGAPSGISVAPPARAKGSLYEAGIRIPMIVSGPAVTRPGRSVAAAVHAVDVFPTLWELGGGTPAAQGALFDGISIAPLLRNKPMPPRPIYSETIGTGFGSGCQRIEGDYKLIRFSDDPVMMPHEEFYDLRADPNETVDLIASGMQAAQRSAYVSASNGLWQLRPLGHIQAFGSDCPTTAGSVRLKSYAPPSLGVMHHMRVLSPGVGTSSTTFLATVCLGTDVPSWNGTPLPLYLDAWGMPGCAIWSPPELFVYTGPTDSIFALPTPNTPSMLGTSVRAQAFVADPAANSGGLVASAGYRFTLGIW